MRSYDTFGTVTTLAQPRTGREFALSRELLGVSLRAVASRLNIDSGTLRRWETDSNPVATERAKQWRAVLAALAEVRAQELGRAGFAVTDIQQTDLGRLIVKLGGRKLG